MSEPLYLAKSADDFPALLPQMTNRHGLITGATGTGKTVTLQTLAERLSYIGVPVFMADVKGDLSGMGAAGTVSPKLQKRIDELGLEGYANYANTVAFWDVFGENGIPVRATISDMGPLLLARLLNLNDTQAGVLQMVFKIADDQGLLLLDLKDLRAMVQHVGDNAAQFKTEYGNVSTASIGAIQRGLLTLEEQGGDVFFGEPMLDINDLMQVDSNGRGVINVLAAEKLIHAPALYSTFLLWLLAELFEQLPEAGDLDKPKLVFFFDEAHLLFDGAPAALVDKVEQVVRLIRSKGVGVFFVTQNPLDVPEKILGQLGNRVQHALRAFTPRDQKAVQSAAQDFVGRLTIHRLAVGGEQRRGFDVAAPFGFGQRAKPRRRREDEGTFDDVRPALLVEEGDQRLADAEFGDDLGGIEFWVGAHRLRGRLHRHLVARGERAQRLQDAVAELAEDILRDVERVLGDE